MSNWIKSDGGLWLPEPPPPPPLQGKCIVCNRENREEAQTGFMGSTFSNHRPTCRHPTYMTCKDHWVPCPVCDCQSEYT